jgi:DNA-binding transcriptional ArsR family regulator
MVEFRLTAADLACTTFSVSALQETVFSLRAWRYPAAHPEHRAGLEQMRPAFARLDTGLLGALVSPRRWIPDFVTPRPAGRVQAGARAGSVDGELAAVRAATPDAVLADIRAAYQGGAIPPVLRDTDPRDLADRIADALAAYWHACLRPRWARMHAILRADIAYRAQVLAQSGARGLFADLTPRVRWHDGVLAIRDPTLPDATIEVSGRGLVLVPTLFQRHPGTWLDPGLPPSLFYPARGRAAVWERADAVVPPPLTELIGASRARLLIRLAEPATTTLLAAEENVTASAVSRHLSALQQAGLLHRSRLGREVWYLRSPLGDSLTGFESRD